MSTVVITGGSRGIGRAAVERFAARGDRVFFLYEKNHAAAREVEAATGATGICCDVADGNAVREAFAMVVKGKYETHTNGCLGRSNLSAYH